MSSTTDQQHKPAVRSERLWLLLLQRFIYNLSHQGLQRTCSASQEMLGEEDKQEEPEQMGAGLKSN